jgi:hypothetical protein
MDLFAPIIVLVILVSVILVITRPFFKSEPIQRSSDAQNQKISKGDYQLVLNRIRELEIEQQEGKISEVDFTTRREDLLLQAVEALKNTEVK